MEPIGLLILNHTKMIIWLALLIPVLTAGVLYVFFNKETVWWEFLIPFAVSALLILIMKLSCEAAQTSDTEYWGEKITQAVYSEPWDEKVSCRHPISCSHPEYCKDKDGKEYQCGYKHSNDGYYHPFDIDYHSEYWEITTEFNNSSNISKQEYERLVTKWGNKNFIDKHRSYYSIDGDWYVTYFPKVDEKIECYVSQHYYENRVQASQNVFNYQEVTDEEKKLYGLYEYPEIYQGYKQKGILGYGDTTQKTAENKVQIINAKLGPKKQVKLFVLVFRNKPEESAYYQECLWKGGNKNEFVLCIGVDDLMKVKWCKPFSFTENQDIKINSRNFVKQQEKLNLSKVADFMQIEIDKNFKRKQFVEFSYLTVEPKTWQVVLTFVLTVIVNVIVSFFLVTNEIKDGLQK